MGAGDLDRKIVFERLSEGALDGFGEPAETWATYLTAKAKREDVKDGEKTASGQPQGSLMCRFTIRSNTKSRALTTSDRLLYEGAHWQVHGVKELSAARRRGYIEVTASRGND